MPTKKLICNSCGREFTSGGNLRCNTCQYNDSTTTRKEVVLRSAKKTKQGVFDYYGNECAYCHTTENLQIDHIDGNGSIERKANNHKNGTRFYQLLKNEGYPKGYQTLCRRCNIAKGQMTDKEFKAWIAMMHSILNAAVSLPETLREPIDPLGLL